MSFLSNSHILEPNWDIVIEPVTSQIFGVYILGSDPNITIDWGDGSIQSLRTNGTYTYRSYSAGKYTVKIKANSGSNGSIQLQQSQGDLIKQTSIIPEIKGLINLNYTFNNCNALQFVPKGIFDKNPLIQSFQGTFFNCESLNFLPEGLFDNNLIVDDFSGCFYNCTSLTEVPSGLFFKNTNVFYFESVFSGVTLTTESYSNLLINMASNAEDRMGNISFDGGYSKYNTNGEIARNILINNNNWSFTDGGLEII